MDLLAAARQAAVAFGRTVTELAGEAVSGGRRHRRVWVEGGKASIEVRGAHRQDLAEQLHAELQHVEGVHWAEVDGVLGRVAVAFDPEGVDPAALLDIVAAVEEAHGTQHDRFSHDQPDHPADVEPLVRQLITIGVDTVALGVAVAGVVVRLAPVPPEVGAAISAIESQPRVRTLVERVIGRGPAEVALAGAAATAHALSQGPMGLVADVAQRGTLAAEAVARRRVWRRRAHDLHAAHDPVVPPELPAEPRPVPLPGGPIERWADRAALASFLGFTGLAAITRSPRRGAAVLVAGVPKAARSGREAFAALLDVHLAQQGVVVLDPQALRRFDRVDTLLLAPEAVCTGRCELSRVVAIEHDEAAARATLAELFDPDDAEAVHRTGGTVVGPIEHVSIPAGEAERVEAVRRQLHRESQHVIALLRNGHVIALAGVVHELDARARAVVTEARAGGLRVVAAGHGIDAERLDLDDVMAGGDRLAADVRELQREGAVVALVACRHGAALHAADVAIGVLAPHHRTPWAADVLTGPGLDGLLHVLRALPAARHASSRAAAIAGWGSATGTLLAVAAPPGQASARAGLAVAGAAIVSVTASAIAVLGLAARPLPLPPNAIPWHELSGDEVLRRLGSRPAGLRKSEVTRRQALIAAGAEVDVAASRRAWWARLLASELDNPLTPVLGAAAGLSIASGSPLDAALIGGVVAVDAGLGAAEQAGARRALRSLGRTATALVAVRRDGNEQRVAPGEVVPGDIVVLHAGDAVPCDCRVVEAMGVEADEASLTGESLPVAKTAAPAAGRLLADRHCMLYEGSTVVAGRAVAIAVAVGDTTEAGRAARAASGRKPPSGVQARLERLTGLALPLALGAGAAVVGTTMLRGRRWTEAVQGGIGLAVAAVPEGLPVVATMAQLAAARRLGRRGALVRDPSTMEALGRVDVLCVDKTGTLTEGELVLARVTDGVLEERGASASGARRPVLAAALRACPATNGHGLAHTTDRAVVKGAAAAGVGAADGLGGWNVTAELPFVARRALHGILGQHPGGATLAVKGAPEAVLPGCTRVGPPDAERPLDDRLADALHAVVDALASRGLRVLAVAERPWAGRADDAELTDDDVSDLALRGFVALGDTVRPQAAGAVVALRGAGVHIAMITGDHPSTAAAIAAELGLDGRVLTGAELDELDDEALTEVLPHVAVFARVAPSQKVRIVGAHQAAGRVVAMTGDGTNDAPAIRLADVGIALGQTGTAAAREAADLVVLDDRLETILDALLEGRALWGSVRDALAILLGGNLGEVAFTLAATAVGGSSPLTPRQLLLVNALTDMLPALAIAVRPPRHAELEALAGEGPDTSLGGALRTEVLIRAGATAAGTTAAWLAARATGTPERARTVALVALVGGQLLQTAATSTRSPLVLGTALASAAVLAGVVQTPPVAAVFGCRPLGPVGWGLAGGGAVLALATSLGVQQLLRPRVPAVPALPPVPSEEAPADDLVALAAVGD